MREKSSIIFRFFKIIFAGRLAEGRGVSWKESCKKHGKTEEKVAKSP